jgi:hypothetical protein
MLKRELGDEWTRCEQRLPKLLQSLGLQGGEHSQSLYIFPQRTTEPNILLEKLRAEADPNERWAILTARSETDNRHEVIAFPVGLKLTANTKKILLALFIETHSRLVAWWLVNAWRSLQLAQATWQLANSMQFIPAAACARSLLETAASLWVETGRLRDMWAETKRDHAASGPSMKEWRSLTIEIWKMMWGGKFDKKVPDMEKLSGALHRTNILTQIESLRGLRNTKCSEIISGCATRSIPASAECLRLPLHLCATSRGHTDFSTSVPFRFTLKSGRLVPFLWPKPKVAAKRAKRRLK